MRCDKEEFKKWERLVRERKVTAKFAAAALGYTQGRFSVLRRKYAELGDRIFVHGLCGKPAANAVPESEKNFIVGEYVKSDCEGARITFRHWRDTLEEEYGVKRSYKTVYAVLTAAGLESPEKRKPKRKKTHRARFRREHFGELLQWDATPFQWFKWAGDTNYYALHGALDDATSSFVGLYMAEHECRYGYIECRRQALLRHGVELEDYSDKSPVFKNNSKENLTIHDQLAGTEKKKPLWREMDDELGIRLNIANSPQAKGKVERAWETVQGRLPAEFKRLGISTVEDANAYLRSRFLDYYAVHFGKPAKSGVSAWRPAPEGLDLETVLCVKEKRVVSNRGTVSFKGLTLLVDGNLRGGTEGYVCVSERSVFFLAGKRRLAVRVQGEFADLSGASQSLERIIHDFMFKELKERAA